MALYYANLIGQKIDLRVDTYFEWVRALGSKDYQKADFIEQMMLEPLNIQIGYLARKASEL